MKELNNFHKYGWITMIAWNLLLVILMLTVSTFCFFGLLFGMASAINPEKILS